MTIVKFLAMEDGEEGVFKNDRVTHIPFAGGGNGVQCGSGGGNWDDNYDSCWVIVPGNTGTYYVEFTSTSNYWNVGFHAGTAVQSSAFFSRPDGLAIARSAGNRYGADVATIHDTPIGEGSHRWGVAGRIHATEGFMEIYCDGVLLLSYTGDTRTSSTSHRATSITRFVFRGRTSARGGVGNFDSVVISTDGFKGDCHVDYLVPDGNGDTNEWLGSDGNSVDNYLLVNEMPPSGAEYVEAEGEDLLDLYTVTNLPASGEILAVEQLISAWKAGPNPQHPLNYVLKTPGGTDVEQGPELLASMQGYSSSTKLLNPEGNPWSVSDINSLQIGVTSEAL